jgi:hypothetical protein
MIRYIFLLFPVFMQCTCTPLTSDNCVENYKFEIPFQFYPQIDTFHLNDTFWIESTIPPLLYDSISKSEQSFGDFQHQIYFHFSSRGADIDLFGSDNFDYINLTGNSQRGTKGPGKLFFAGYETLADNSRVIKVAFIPKKIGLYSFGMLHFYEDYQSDDGIIKEGCTEEITLRYRTNDRNPDNNFEMLEGTVAWPHKAGMLEDGGYAFRVVE